MSKAVLAAIVWGGLVAFPVCGQIVPDGTLPVNSTIVPTGDTTFAIEGGTPTGTNLFHSFSEFSVLTGTEAFFNNAMTIENIITRVTGSNISNIDGVLRTNGAANLYLLNPNGIIFGPNASLQVNGSFFASSSDRVTFADGIEFSTNTGTGAPLLTVSVPLGIQNNIPQGAIDNAANLSVGTGQTLSFNATTLRSRGELSAPQGTIALFGNRIQFLDGSGFDGDFIAFQATEDIVIDRQSDGILEFAPGLGPILIRADADRNGTGAVVMENASPTRNISGFNPDVNFNEADTLLTSGRDIAIIGSNLILGNIDTQSRDRRLPPDGAGQQLDTALDLASGGVTLDRIEGITVNDDIDLFRIFILGDGNFAVTLAEDSIIVPDIFLFDENGLGIAFSEIGVLPESAIFPPLEAGVYYLGVASTGATPISEEGPIFPDPSESSNSILEPESPGGDLPLLDWETNVLPGRYALNFSGVTANVDRVVESSLPTTPTPSGGEIVLEATHGSISTAALNSDAFSELNDTENGGNITLTAAEDITVNGLIDSRSLSPISSGLDTTSGVGGNVRLQAGNDVIFFGSDLESGAMENRGGDIAIVAGGNIRFSEERLGFISSGRDRGTGGNISFEAGGSIILADFIVTSESNFTAGAIAFTAGEDIRLSDTNIESSGGSFRAPGQSGTISVTAIGNIILDEASINSFSDRGNSGEIRLQSDSNINAVSSFIGASSSRDGDAGNIAIAATGNIDFEDTNIRSRSESRDIPGNGGRIDLTAGGDLRFADDSIETDVDRGHGGDIYLNATGNLTFKNGALRTFSSSDGDAGNITIEVGNNATLTDIWIEATSADSAGGNVSWQAGGNLTADLELSLPFEVSAIETNGIASRGNLQIQAGGNILITGDRTSSLPDIDTSGSGTGGDISMVSTDGTVTLDDILAVGDGIGNGSGGNIFLSGNAIALNESEIAVLSRGIGNAGSLQLQARETILTNFSRLFTSLDPGAIGRGGDVTIDAPSITLENVSFVDTATFGNGDAGNVSILGNNLALDASSIFSVTAGTGRGGNVTIAVNETVSLANSSNISTAATRSATGNGGNIDISTGSLSVLGGSQLQTLTRASGTAGDININSAETVIFSGIGVDGFLSGAFSFTTGTQSGRGGDINLRSRQLQITNGAVLNAQTGSLNPGGNIEVNANSVELRNGGQIRTDTSGSGQAGNITVTVSESLILAGVDGNFDDRPTPVIPPRSNVSIREPQTLAERESGGSLAGAQFLDDSVFSLDPIDNTNPNVEFSDRVPYVSISGSGSEPPTNDIYAFEVVAGSRGFFDIDDGDTQRSLPTDNNFTLTLRDSNGNELISNDEAPFFVGAGGSVPLDEDSEFPNLAQQSDDPYIRFTFNQGGTYFLEVGGKFIETDPATGDFILNPETGFPMLFDGILDETAYTLQVSLDSPNVAGSTLNLENTDDAASSGLFAGSQTTGSAGTITVNAPHLRIGDRAGIIVNTTAGTEGNIIVNSRDLRLTGGGRIQTNAVGEATGGNIVIDTDTLVALENSDISANATQARGGNIEITTDGIFGTEFRLQATENSDITATGGTPDLQGQVRLNTPDVDSTSGVVELADNPIDAASLLGTDICSQTRDNRFTIIGRGGLPPRPADAFSARQSAIAFEWLEAIDAENSAVEIRDREPETAIVEAGGWYRDEADRIVLSAPVFMPFILPENCSSRARGFRYQTGSETMLPSN